MSPKKLLFMDFEQWSPFSFPLIFFSSKMKKKERKRRGRGNEKEKEKRKSVFGGNYWERVLNAPILVNENFDWFSSFSSPFLKYFSLVISFIDYWAILKFIDHYLFITLTWILSSRSWGSGICGNMKGTGYI